MKNIYLIGMMGCGKSTCAKALGIRLGLPVLDTDQEIEKTAGCSVSEIFEKQGEKRFRELETDLCRALAGREGLIVATGGGLPLGAENRALLRESGTVLFLNRDPAEIFDTGDMSGRPLAQQGKDAFLQRFSERLPLYRQCAHGEITNFASVWETVAELLRYVEEGL